MQILAGDPFDQRVNVVRFVPDWFDDDPTCFLAHVDRFIKFKRDCFHYCSRNAHGSTVPPFLHNTLHRLYTSFPLICQMALACQQCRYSGTTTVERVSVGILGTVLGTVSLKKVKKSSKGLQMLSARRHCFCLEIQTNVNSFEADRNYKNWRFESGAYVNSATPVR